jgi:hypothetical protein
VKDAHRKGQFILKLDPASLDPALVSKLRAGQELSEEEFNQLAAKGQVVDGDEETLVVVPTAQVVERFRERAEAAYARRSGIVPLDSTGDSRFLYLFFVTKAHQGLFIPVNEYYLKVRWGGREQLEQALASAKWSVEFIGTVRGGGGGVLSIPLNVEARQRELKSSGRVTGSADIDSLLPPTSVN